MGLVEIKSVTVTEKGQIAIPKDLRAIAGFKEGSKIAILAFKGRIELRPLSQISEKIQFALASEKSLAKEWEGRDEDDAWRDL